jgi:hypothetical protein
MKPGFHPLNTVLAAATGIACATALLNAEPAHAATTFYGIDNNNNIWEVDPLRKFNVLVNEVGSTIPNCAATPGCLNTSQGSNGIAFDSGRDHLFFFYNPKVTNNDNSWNLQFWNRKSRGISSLKTISGVGGSNNIPANASYYKDALWYFDGTNNSNLNKLQLTYNTDQDDVTSTSLTTYNLANFAAPKYAPAGYGDIAINALTGFLYGSQVNGNFFKLDLNKIDNQPNSANSIFTALGKTQTLGSLGDTFVDSGLQLSFNSDYSKLYGTRFCNTAANCSGYDGDGFSAQNGDGLFFEINDIDTAVTRQFEQNELLFATSPGFRDLGGATSSALVPGPLPILGVGGAFAWSRQLRRRISAGKPQARRNNPN